MAKIFIKEETIFYYVTIKYLFAKIKVQVFKIKVSTQKWSWHPVPSLHGHRWRKVEIFLGSKVIADGDCSHGIKRCLLLGRKAMRYLKHIKKQWHHCANKGWYCKGCGFFQQSCMDVRVGPERRLSTEEFLLLNCGVGEDSWESLGLQEDQTSPS